MTKTRTSTTRSEPKGLKIERTFKAPIEKVWSLWTTKKGVESWWGPEGFTTTVHTLDLRPGGAFNYTMKATGKEQIAALKQMGVPLTSSASNTYTEVTPPRRLAFRTRVDFIPGAEPSEVLSEVEFLAVPGGTKVVFTSEKMPNAQWQEMARLGWTSQLDKLARILGA